MLKDYLDALRRIGKPTAGVLLIVAIPVIAISGPRGFIGVVLSLPFTLPLIEVLLK